MASHMRLRLMVRRNGLPETNVIWPVALENRPTISRLLEQVNEIIPLESADWGLEDYTVELKGNDGSSFECLHFQPVQCVLKEDDQVLIRPLFTDDLQQRRVSGRHQISNDGRHLIDGIAFGRPLVRTPRGRPALDIPPRKRRRIGFQEEEQEEEMDMIGDEDDDADYADSQDIEEPMLFLTNGEEQPEDRRRSVRIATDFDDEDADLPLIEDQPEDENMPASDMSDENLNQDCSSSDESSDEDMEYELDEDDEDYLAEELEDLQSDEGTRPSLQPLQSVLPKLPQDPWKESARQTSRRSSANSIDSVNNEVLERELVTSLPKELLNLPKELLTGSLPDIHKMGALKTAFPMAPGQVCREILTAEEGDVKRSYLTLLQAFQPKITESEALKLSEILKVSELFKQWYNGGGQLPNSGVQGNNDMDVSDDEDQSAEDDNSDDDAEDEDDEEDEGDIDFIRRFDRQGLPPGTISSGNALKAMADLVNGVKTVTGVHTSFEEGCPREATRQTTANIKGNFEDPSNLDSDDTSSSGSSSSSEEGEDVENGSSSEDLSSDSNDESDGVNSTLDGGVNDSDTSSSENSSESDSDSLPEEQSTRRTSTIKRMAGINGYITSDTTSSSEDSDADDETSSSDDSSEDDSSDSESSSGSESEDVPISTKKTAVKPTINKTPQLKSPDSAQHIGIPGTGSISTRKRNERRRLKLKADREAAKAAQAAALGLSPPHQNSLVAAEPKSQALEKSKAEREKELFEAKRQALLDAIASGGVEVGPGGELGLNDFQIGNKRKRQEPEPPKETDCTPKTSADLSNETPKDNPVTAVAEGEADSSSSMQKRRKLDMGANRRLIFGALGLRNPKTKDDEDKLRNKLMKDVRPLQNARLSEKEAETDNAKEHEQQQGNVLVAVEEDHDAWRQKIDYRAVECCQDGVELSEPPFPFVQRWDPQQQNTWYHKNNKRGGHGKRAERNQSHFYQNGKIQKDQSFRESQDWDESYYDNSMEAVQEPDSPANVELNYDDFQQEDRINGTDETSHLTDADDLPSLPQNLEELKPLHPGEAQNGMVITWKQFILSKATSWQPQVLSLTGVICKIDDDATGLEILLAKRDRDLEMPEKEYDDHTGQRVYNRFEVPDADDEEEEEDEESKRMREGYRTLTFAMIQDPRILQPAIPLGEPTGGPTVPSIEGEKRVPKEPIEPHPDNNIEDLKKSVVDENNAMEPKDTTFEGFDDSILPRQEAEAMDNISNKAQDTDTIRERTTSGEPFEIPDSFKEGTAQNSSSGLSGKAKSPAEISVSDLSQVSSPLRQLNDETPRSINDVLAGDVLSTGPSENNPASMVETTFDPTLSDQASDHEEFSMQIHDTDVIMGTPKVSCPRSDVLTSSMSSVRSGRQLDICMDMEIDQSDTFRATAEEYNDQDKLQSNEVSVGVGEDTNVISDNKHRNETPEPSSTQNVASFDTKPSSSHIRESPSKQQQHLADSAASTPCSLESLGTVWCTAATSQRNTQSPSKLFSSVASSKSQPLNDHDAEYLEAMRKLDDFSDEDEVSQSARKISDRFKKKSQSSTLPTQSSSSGGTSGSDHPSLLPAHARTDSKISPPPILRQESTKQSVISSSPPIKTRDSPPASNVRRSKRTSSQFGFPIPPGTQILDISSDSDEPKFVEHYADDDKDESYSPTKNDEEDFSPAILPKGSDQTKKNRPLRRLAAPLASPKKAQRAKRAVSATQNSDNSQPRVAESAAAAMKRLKRRPKKR